MKSRTYLFNQLEQLMRLKCSPFAPPSPCCLLTNSISPFLSFPAPKALISSLSL
jgi:hypothetical protein